MKGHISIFLHNFQKLPEEAFEPCSRIGYVDSMQHSVLFDADMN